MKIGELSRLTGVSVRALRYYEEEGPIRPTRGGNGYRDYCEGADEVVRQIRGLIECGLPTRIVRDILPYPKAGGAAR
ncbi:MerR family transcriptional regulator [Kitasatospora sp. NPDC052868]|uniref:MerR family transcriptional regulator n=1 Tax=Kitasatospora sp. NPDC052868 TaxID=3364060 RepID=UPI0037C971C5